MVREQCSPRERERYLSAVNYCSSKRYHGAGVTANYIFPDRQFTQLGSRISTQLAAKSIPKYSPPPPIKIEQLANNRSHRES